MVAVMVKCLPTMQKTQVQFLGQEDLEKEMATDSSILAWNIPWMEKPGRLQSVGSQRVGHDGATSLSMVVQPCEYTKKTSDLYNFKWWILWYVNYISIKKINDT